MDRYLNRQAAGQMLATALAQYAKKKEALVLALPRGGVPVGYEIAKALQTPLDVFIVRKLGVPGHEELAMGAIAMGGICILNDNIIRELRISPEAIKRVSQEEQKELERRIERYRGSQPFPTLSKRLIILVDDGIATGATIRAAVTALKKEKPAKLIIAVPVAEKSTCEKLSALVDQFICPLRPLYFNAVGTWYESFDQTSDEEVRSLLKKAKKFEAVAHRESE
ncbi:MAG TPA: phosphoribosyltransferase [Gammaproteobacteria bacterium]|nr:phosphoribosyltransferase [Gammaproteobacteria bacterium]